jgi:quinol-cytochrome oxidoreductase complex cytochrome b subunit
MTGILSGVLFAAGAGVGISLFITHTYWSVKYTITVTLFALLIAYFSFRMARHAITGKKVKLGRTIQNSPTPN